MADVVRICFVCLGNICRSPTAEAVMRHLVKQEGLERKIAVESAGTGDWHVGSARDRRSQATGKARGIPLSGTARQFTAADFARYDYVVAMDRANRDALLAMAGGADDRAKVSLLRGFDPDAPAEAEVPDPYFGGPAGSTWCSTCAMPAAGAFWPTCGASTGSEHGGGAAGIAAGGAGLGAG